MFGIIFFRLFNFAILVGLGYYLFKKYARNAIDEAITQKEMLLKGLEEQGYFLEGKVHTLDMRLEFQEKKNADLKQKIDEWGRYIFTQNNKRQEEFRLNVMRMGQRVIIKNEYLEKQLLRKKVIPQAIAHAKDILTQEFADGARAQNYVHAVVTYLEGKQP